MLGATSIYPAWLAFIAFLVQHTSHLKFNGIAILNDNQTSFEANAIAAALHLKHHPITSLYIYNGQYKDYAENHRTIPIGALVISLISGDFYQLFQDKKSTAHRIYLKKLEKNNKWIQVLTDDTAASLKRFEVYNLNIIHVVLCGNGELDFVVFPTFLDEHPVPSKRFNGAAQFVGSIDWLAFSDRLERMPNGTKVMGEFTSSNQMQLELIIHQGHLHLTGYFIGLLRIICDQTGVTLVEMQNLVTININRVVAILDKRQTWPHQVLNQSLFNRFIIGLAVTGDFMPAISNQFVYLAPRQLIPSEVTWMDALRRILILGLLLGISLIFLTIRLICQQMRPANRLDPGDLLFDTFARILSISAGTWRGASSAERQLLVIVSAFAILMAGVFSGVLYEQNMINDEKQRFNTPQELCDAGIKLTTDNGLYLSILFALGTYPELGLNK